MAGRHVELAPACYPSLLMAALPPFARTRGSALAAGAVVSIVGSVGFSSLFAGPGYESSLVAGLVLPFAVAPLVAVQVARSTAQPRGALARGLWTGAALAALAYGVILAQGLRAGLCDVVGGSTLFALGPAAGALMAGAWGAFAGALGQGRRRPRLIALGVAVLGPLGSMLVSLLRFYTSPIIFAYDPYVGFFSGSFYDTVIDASRLGTYRLGSLATLIFVGIFAELTERRVDGRVALDGRRRPGLLVVGSAALVASVGVTLEGPRLGHWQTASSIQAELGGRTEGRRCVVIHPRGMSRDDVTRFVAECDGHVAQKEAWLGTRGPDVITAYLFASAEQKERLMGAANTYIAKPWRHEVYLQAAGYPHPVLGHELAHVIAGAFGRGPFRIAGSLGGVLPDPGLIEGIAVAAAPTDSELTPAEWSKAMKDLGLLPPLGRLFALGFLGENSSVAYTASGAFVGWVHDNFGAEVLRGWYGGGDLARLTGTSLRDLEERWRRDLDALTLSEAARAAASARFDRPALFARRCPHQVDTCKVEAASLGGAGDYLGAIALYERALSLDPGDVASRLGVARSLLSDGKIDEGARALGALSADPDQSQAARDRATEDLGDLALASGDLEQAERRYRSLRATVIDEDRLRTLDVKLRACGDAIARPAIVALLIGAPDRGPDPLEAARLLGAWSEAHPSDGLPAYLLARTAMNSGRYADATRLLDAARGRALEPASVAHEAARLRTVVACAQGDVPTARQVFAEGETSPTLARRAYLADFIERSALSP